MVGVYSETELKERTLLLVVNIITAAERLDDLVTKNIESWATWKGNLFKLLTSLDKFNRFFMGLAEPEKRLKNMPFDYATISAENAKWIVTLENLTVTNIPQSTKNIPSNVATDILELDSIILAFYDTLRPVIEKLLDSEFETPLSEISKLTSEYSNFIDGNWAIAVSYIALMDGFINRMRYRFKNSGKDKNKDNTMSFDQRYSELQEKFHEKGIEVLPGTIGKAKALWSLRTDILHYAQKPNREETKMIKSWVTEVISEFSRAEEKWNGLDE